MAKFERLTYTKGAYSFYCPGCKFQHSVWTIKEDSCNNPVWTFNGDLDKPTVSPSLLVRYPADDKNNICHSFIKDGNIQFLGDCTHELKGKTVEIPEIEY